MLTLQRKYDSYGTTSRTNWGVAFSRAVATAASTTVADVRLRDRLEDTQSEVGRDAHRATELTLAMQRNSIFLAQRALTAPEAQALNDAAQKELTAIQAKYGPTVASTGDFNDRLARLVRTGTAAQRQDWEREALAARDAAAAKLAADRQAAAAAAQQAAAQQSGVSAAAWLLRLAHPRPNTATRRAAAGSAGPSSTSAPIARVRSDRTLSWRPIFLLLLVGGGGAGYYAYRGKRRASPARFSDVKERYTSVSTAPSTARVTASSSPPPAAELPPDATVKERLLAEQRQKYQVRSPRPWTR